MLKRGQLHSPKLNAAIYKQEVDELSRQPADILVCHEAPSCHPFGWAELDKLGQELGVVRVFHGHTHDDRTLEYKAHQVRMGFETVAVNYRCIKNGLGETVLAYTLSESSTV
ncbi:hypothetical protein NBRC116584_29960 [Hydrogenophaga sp. 5NK40-0174]